MFTNNLGAKKLSTVQSVHINAIDQSDVNYIVTTTQRENIFQSTIDSISRANTQNQPFAYLMELNYSGNYTAIEQCNWRPALQTILAHYESTENYERCATVHALMGTLA